MDVSRPAPAVLHPEECSCSDSRLIMAAESHQKEKRSMEH
jgi:hypothetical protein